MNAILSKVRLYVIQKCVTSLLLTELEICTRDRELVLRRQSLELCANFNTGLKACWP